MSNLRIAEAAIGGVGLAMATASEYAPRLPIELQLAALVVLSFCLIHGLSASDNGEGN